MKINILFATVFAFLSVGCASVKYQSPPPQSTNKVQHEIYKSPLLAETSHVLKHINSDEDILYYQTFGGGGVGVGLLLGPIGVAANIAAINSNTEEDVKLLKGKINLSPVTLFKKASVKNDFSLSSNAVDSIKVTPYLYVSKTDSEQLLFASAILVETLPGSKNNWVGKYMYQTQLKIPKSDIADGINDEELKMLTDNFEQGMQEVIKLYSSDRRGLLKTEQPITFISDFVSPRFKLELLGEKAPTTNQREVIRTVGGIYSLPTDLVEIKLKKSKK
ncbi:hypothetical protein JQC92_12810 [Shewanella sp. 202IG2-18]|uniref:hypothetical protein n=1 Tax=Parashewanella hymeniacidonis TaxID=2807618 RepID=UPI0019615410|nr:hypothetical protein [Parashewanella hymeniacidonis]MBM7072901.1 hypothetical protein [Parashewanella hymeniacidonis]